MNFKKVNNITGWAVFLIALATYFMTREARGSFWDTGEFIASADKMQLPHPPGAPMFTLLGRFFIILFGDNDLRAASAVNFMSALASAATILFLFWSVTHFARKMFVKVGEDLTSPQTFTVMAAGAVGALAYTFSDSFWYSAVEGEVYALSSFFTALVFWAMLKWEHADEHAGNDPFAKARSDRWIIFLFFMMGLSIGVHLLNLLTIPAIVMIYYYRRYQATKWGSILAFVIGCLVTGIVQVAVIQYSMKLAGQFDILFVNGVGAPFFAGFTAFFISLSIAVVLIIRSTYKSNFSFFTIVRIIIYSTAPLIILAIFGKLSNSGKGDFVGKMALYILILAVQIVAFFYNNLFGRKKQTQVKQRDDISVYNINSPKRYFVRLGLFCFAFMMLGYSLYFTALIRSNANPAIDMNNVDNPINLVYYLSREQYGSAPIVYGPHFAAQPEEIVETEMKYVRGKDSYIPIGRSKEYGYPASEKQLFPRIWDPSNDQYHAMFYAQWLNIPQDPQTGKYQAPTYGQNMEWFFTYQMGLMYWRYFMWNFAGRQNDVQGLGNVRDGNWITGISFIDNARLGDQSKMPDSVKYNKANNKLFLLPFVLGIIGCTFQFLRNRKDWIVSFLLFFMTGIAVVIYLNQPGNQPRERDYAYVGSFFAFAIWIGLAVPAFVKMVQEKTDKLNFQNMLIYGGSLTFLIGFFSAMPGPGTALLLTPVFMTVLYLLVTGGLTFLFRAISSAGQNLRVLNIATAVTCLIVPLIMAQQEWDDHDRSQKTLAPDIAKDYLESCAPNAIIFTFGDNDTYPLWYAQEVEGVRPDIRIINNSLLGIDWYINQLRYKVNEADSVDVILNPEQIEGHNREFVRYRADPKAGDGYYDLYNIIKTAIARRSEDPQDPSEQGKRRDVGANITFPVARVGVAVDSAVVFANGTVNKGDEVLPQMLFEIPQRKLEEGLYRNDLIILAIIAANKWKRPIYFTSPMGELGFGNYLRKDGMAYRLVPVLNKFPQVNWVTDSLLRATGVGGTQIRDNNDAVIYNNLTEKFEFGGANIKGVYFDEENRRHLLNIRSLYAEAAGNLADGGDKEKAKKLLETVEAGIDPENLLYGMVSRYSSHNQTGLLYLEACYKAGKLDLAEKVKAGLKKDLDQQKSYYAYLAANKPDLYTGTIQSTEEPLNEVMQAVLTAIENKYAKKNTISSPTEVGGNPIISSPSSDSQDKK